MIKFEALAIKAKTNEIHMIFLLKKNIRTNIIKIIILEYPPIVVSKTLRKWKVEITLVRQGYKSIESQQVTKLEQKQPMEEKIYL